MFGPTYSEFWLIAVAAVILYGVAIAFAARFIRPDPSESER
jgi:hypothetical protein